MHSKTAYEKTTRSQLGESAVFPCIRNIVLDILNQQLLVTHQGIGHKLGTEEPSVLLALVPIDNSLRSADSAVEPVP